MCLIKIRRTLNGENKKMYVTAEEAAEILGVSTGYAYKIIRGLNEELKEKGYRTICGKVPTKYFEEKFYGLTVTMWPANKKSIEN